MNLRSHPNLHLMTFGTLDASLSFPFTVSFARYSTIILYCSEDLFDGYLQYLKSIFIYGTLDTLATQQSMKSNLAPRSTEAKLQIFLILYTVVKNKETKPKKVFENI
jgi:hypothetical protein